MPMRDRWFKAYRGSSFAFIEAIICGWLLVLSFWLPARNIERFMPDLWRPIFPFQYFEYSDLKMAVAVWAWRTVLLACVLVPRNTVLLACGFVLSFFCLGIQNCFTLEMQLFAPLQLAFFFLFLFSLLSGRYGNMDKPLAFAIKLTMVLLFFSAGLSKLKWSGVSWAWSESLLQYFQVLYQTNRDVLGSEGVLAIRHYLLENPFLIRLGSVGVHAFELLSPLALFSQRASRVLMLGALAFVFSVLFFFGIQFFTILPLIVIWGVWDVTWKDLVSLAVKPSLVPIGLAFSLLLTMQLTVTLYLEKNSWPIMANDMYAKPIGKTPFVDSKAAQFSLLREFTVEVINRDGSRVALSKNAYFAPFSRFHMFIALLKIKGDDARTALLDKVLDNYRRHTCTGNCDQAVGMIATQTFDASTVTLAQTKRE